jgi:hypothetical protein
MVGCFGCLVCRFFRFVLVDSNLITVWLAQSVAGAIPGDTATAGLLAGMALNRFWLRQLCVN